MDAITTATLIARKTIGQPTAYEAHVIRAHDRVWIRLLDVRSARGIGYWSKDDSHGTNDDVVERTLEELVAALCRASQGGRMVSQLMYWPQGWSYWAFTPAPLSEYVVRGAYEDDVQRMMTTPMLNGL